MMRLAFILPSVLAVGPCSYTTKDGKLTYSLDAVSLKTAACVTRACFARKERRAPMSCTVCAVKHKRKRTTTVYYFIARWTHFDARFSFRALLFPRPPIVSLHFFPSHIHTT